MYRLKVGSTWVRDWFHILATVSNIILITEAIQESGARELLSVPSPNIASLQKVSKVIGDIFDLDQSAFLKRFSVKAGIDADLDKLKRVHNGLSELLTLIVRQDADKLINNDAQCQMIYIPKLGYLIAVHMTPEQLENSRYDLVTTISIICTFYC